MERSTKDDIKLSPVTLVKQASNFVENLWIDLSYRIYFLPRDEGLLELSRFYCIATQVRWSVFLCMLHLLILASSGSRLTRA